MWGRSLRERGGASDGGEGPRWEGRGFVGMGVASGVGELPQMGGVSEGGALLKREWPHMEGRGLLGRGGA